MCSCAQMQSTLKHCFCMQTSIANKECRNEASNNCSNDKVRQPFCDMVMSCSLFIQLATTRPLSSMTLGLIVKRHACTLSAPSDAVFNELHHTLPGTCHNQSKCATCHPSKTGPSWPAECSMSAHAHKPARTPHCELCKWPLQTHTHQHGMAHSAWSGCLLRCCRNKSRP